MPSVNRRADPDIRFARFHRDRRGLFGQRRSEGHTAPLSVVCVVGRCGRWSLDGRKDLAAEQQRYRQRTALS